MRRGGPQHQHYLDRAEFCRLYQELFEKVLEYPRKHQSWKTPEGRELVQKLRERFNYSPRSANCDLYWSATGLYIDLREAGIVKPGKR